MRTLTCVYCFKKFQKNDIQYRCLNPNKMRCADVLDDILAEYKDMPAGTQYAGKIVSGPSGNSSKRVNCTCGAETKPICPLCHNDLPHQFGESECCSIALIGAKAVGKSHYIAVLIHELKQRIGARFNASLGALDEFTMKKYNDDLWRYLYENKEKIPETQSFKSQIENKKPLVYRLSVNSKNILGLAQKKEVDLVFFDTAGEDLTDLDIMNIVNRYIASADGIIFLLDPLQIKAVKDSLPPDVPVPDLQTNQEDVISRSTMLIQKVNNMRASKKIDIPIAVAFTKMDALHGIIDPILLRAGTHNGYFNKTEHRQVNDLFAGYIDNWFGGNLLRLIENQYTDFSFFGLSAIGSSPDVNGKISSGITPFRIEDPLLWLLYKKGIIKGK